MSTEAQRQAWRERKRRQRIREGTALAPLGDGGGNPPSREWLLDQLGAQARRGNVAACRVLLEEYRRDERKRRER